MPTKKLCGAFTNFLWNSYKIPLESLLISFVEFLQNSFGSRTDVIVCLDVRMRKRMGLTYRAMPNPLRHKLVFIWVLIWNSVWLRAPKAP